MTVFTNITSKSHVPNPPWATIHYVRRNGLLSKALLALIILHLVEPVASMENVGYGTLLSVTNAVPDPDFSTITPDVAVGGFLGLIILARGRLKALKNLLAPIMAATSVLFIILKNNGPVDPVLDKVSWGQVVLDFRPLVTILIRISLVFLRYGA